MDAGAEAAGVHGRVRGLRGLACGMVWERGGGWSAGVASGGSGASRNTGRDSTAGVGDFSSRGRKSGVAAGGGKPCVVPKELEDGRVTARGFPRGELPGRGGTGGALRVGFPSVWEEGGPRVEKSYWVLSRAYTAPLLVGNRGSELQSVT